MKSNQDLSKKINRQWHIFSAKDKVLGRLATNSARLLIGKHKRTYMPNIDTGDFVVVTDAREVVVTGRKEENKTYDRYSGYPGGRRTIPFSRMRSAHPERIIEHAVRGMLPKNKLRSKRMARLKVFSGSQHPYGDRFKTQNPEIQGLDTL